MAPVAALALICALPVLYLLRRINPAWLMSAGIALSVFNSKWGQIGVEIPIDRALLLASIACVLLSPINRQKLRDNITPLHWLLVALSAYAIGSAVFAGTLNGLFIWALFDSLAIIPFVIFAFAPVVFAREADRKILLGALTVLGGYLSLTAIVEITGPVWLVFPSYIADPTIVTHLGRARGPMLEAVANGVALFACGTAAAIGAPRWSSRVARELGFIVAVACAVGLVFTLTRSIWLGSAVALIVGVVTHPSGRRYFVPIIGASAIGVLALLAIVPGLESSANSRLDEQSPVWDRYNTNAAAIRIMQDKPLFGSGWATFPEVSLPYMWQADDYPLRGAGLKVHNVPLQIGSELGLVGLTMWSIALVAAIATGFRAARRAGQYLLASGLLAMMVCWGFAMNLAPLGQAFSSLAPWTLAGLAISYAPQKQVASSEKVEPVRI